MKAGELRVRTQKCSLCEWTMPSWFDTPEEVKAAFTGHRTSIASCAQAKLVPIPGAENAPLGKVAATLQSLYEAHGETIQVVPVSSAWVQAPDSKCGHS